MDVSTPEIFNFIELDVDVDLSEPTPADLKLLSSFDGNVLDIQPMVPPSTGLAPSKLEAETGAFNISWCNDPDRTPAPVPVRKECKPALPMPEERSDTPGAAKLPLPKPRGIRRAPEPEDAEHAEKRLKVYRLLAVFYTLTFFHTLDVRIPKRISQCCLFTNLYAPLNLS